MAKKAVGNLAIVVSANTEAAIKGFQKVGAAGKTMAGKLGKVAFGESFGGGGGKGGKGGGGGGGGMLDKVTGGAGLVGLAGKAFPAIAAINSVGAAISKVSQEFSAAMVRIDATAKTAEKLGMTSNALRGLRHAAQKSGVDAGTLDMAMQRMSRRIAEAATGSGEAQGILQELGLSAQKLVGMAPDKQFLAITEAAEKVGMSGHRLRTAFKLFDSEGAALVNTMNMGSDAIRGYMKESDALNGTLASDDAMVADFNDALLDMNKALEGVWNEISIILIPVVQFFVEVLEELFKSIKRFLRFITGRDLIPDTVGVSQEAKAAEAMRKAMEDKRIKEEEEANKKAADAAKKAAEDMQNAADSMRESLATPMERAQKAIADAMHLFQMGAISAGTAGRAIKKAQDDLLAATKPTETRTPDARRTFGAVLKGTMAEANAIRQQRAEMHTAKQQRKKMLAEANRRRRILTQIAENTSGGATIRVAGIGP